MNHNSNDVPQWGGYIILAIGTLLYTAGQHLPTIIMVAWAKQRVKLIHRLPLLRGYLPAPTKLDCRLLTVAAYIFATLFLVAGVMVLLRR